MDTFYDAPSDTMQEHTQRYERERGNNLMDAYAQAYDFLEQHTDASANIIVPDWNGEDSFCRGHGDVCADCGNMHPCEC